MCIRDRFFSQRYKRFSRSIVCDIGADSSYSCASLLVNPSVFLARTFCVSRAKKNARSLPCQVKSASITNTLARCRDQRHAIFQSKFHKSSLLSWVTSIFQRLQALSNQFLGI